MRHYKLVLGLFIVAILSFSCSNELELTAPWKDIPVVYGKISLTDTAQYIRVERAFLDPEKSALEFTKNPDSIYYKNATVRLVHVPSGNVYTLTRVDGNLEGYVRDTGIWAQSPNYLYKIRSQDMLLSAGDEYELVIEKGGNLPDTKARTKMVGIPQIISPSSSGKIGFSYTSKYFVTWKKAAGGAIYDLDFVFHYLENSEAAPDVFVSKQLKWKAVKGVKPVPGEELITAKFEGIEFYRWLGASLPAGNIQRKFAGMDIVVAAGGEELLNYIEVSLANFGITGSETTTSYTNIPGGVGVFSSVSIDSIAGMQLSSTALDLLKNGELTAPLNFIQ